MIVISESSCYTNVQLKGYIMENSLYKYNRNIDFLRFLFCTIIIIFHMYNDNLSGIYGQLDTYQLFAKNTSRSWIIVEIFLSYLVIIFIIHHFMKSHLKNLSLKKLYDCGRFLLLLRYWKQKGIFRLIQ